MAAVEQIARAGITRRSPVTRRKALNTLCFFPFITLLPDVRPRSLVEAAEGLKLTPKPLNHEEMICPRA